MTGRVAQTKGQSEKKTSRPFLLSFPFRVFARKSRNGKNKFRAKAKNKKEWHENKKRKKG
jgi:hypothetical protein